MCSDAGNIKVGFGFFAFYDLQTIVVLKDF